MFILCRWLDGWIYYAAEAEDEQGQEQRQGYRELQELSNTEYTPTVSRFP